MVTFTGEILSGKVHFVCSVATPLNLNLFEILNEYVND